MNSPLAHTISVMQVIWGGRWQVGSACSTGEEVEQINSHMSRCGNTTKYMLPESELRFISSFFFSKKKNKKKKSHSGEQVNLLGSCFPVKGMSYERNVTFLSYDIPFTKKCYISFI